MDDISRGELATFISRQQDQMDFLEAVHRVIRQKAD